MGYAEVFSLLLLVNAHFVPVIGGLLSGIWDAISGGVSDIGSFISNPFGFILSKFGDWVEGLFSGVVNDLQSLFTGSVPHNMNFLYGVMAPSGLVVAGIAGAARVTRGMFDPRQEGMTLIVDNLLRFGFAFLAIEGGGGIVFQGITGLINAIAYMSPQLVLDFSEGAVKGADPLVALFNAVVIGTLSAFDPLQDLFLIIIMVCMVLGAIYIAFLWVGRFIMMAFMLAFAPICIAVAVYDPKNKFVQWWTELFLAVAIMPAILWGVVGITVGLGISTVTKDAFIGPLIAGIMAIGSLWFLAKIINRLVWSGFSHGSFTGAITAASSAAMALPLAANDLSIVGRMAGMKNAAEVAGAGGKPGLGNRAMSTLDKFAGMGVSRFGTGPYGTARPTEISNQASGAKNAFSQLSESQQSQIGDKEDFNNYATGIATMLDPSVASGLLSKENAGTFASLAYDTYQQHGNGGAYGSPQRVTTMQQAAADITSHYMGGKTAGAPVSPASAPVIQQPTPGVGRFGAPIGSSGPSSNSPLSQGGPTASPATTHPQRLWSPLSSPEPASTYINPSQLPKGP